MLFVPLFALICAGFVLVRIGFPDPRFWPAAERVNYFILFPALLVVSLVDAPVRDPAILRLGGAAILAICLAAAGLAIGRTFRHAPAARFGPTFQGVVRFNTYLGLAITGSLAGAEGLSRAAVVLAVAVPLVNVFSIMALTEASVLRSPRALSRALLGNPLIVACAAGIVLALAGARLPYGAGRFLELLAQASLPLGLLCVGAALRPNALRKDGAALAGIASLRLLGMPVLAALISRVLGLEDAEALVLIIFFAIPTAPTSYVLTRQLNGDGALMAGLVTAQTFAAVATIPLVLMVLD